MLAEISSSLDKRHKEQERKEEGKKRTGGGEGRRREEEEGTGEGRNQQRRVGLPWKRERGVMKKRMMRRRKSRTGQEVEKARDSEMDGRRESSHSSHSSDK